ncbi:MAG: hypothetical protein PUB37_03140 [Firmicutes bacterium]|nr:hypothetical protein [Bacillota bacterium]
MNNNLITDIAESQKLPVFIGVTGHRNIRCNGEDGIMLREAVERVISEITGIDKATGKSNKYPHTEFALLTSLAAGADQFVTKVAVEMGLKYGVVLPMKREKFLNRKGGDGIADFTAQEKAEAERFMDDEAHCLFVYELPEIGDDDTQFSEAAHFVSDNSYTGIALWDGLVSPMVKAGTGAAVRDSLHGITYRSNCFSGITIPETRPIYHIYAPRENASFESKNFFRSRSVFPQPLLETGENWFSLNGLNDDEISKRFAKDWQKENGKIRKKKFEEKLKNIDDYNRNVMKHKDWISQDNYKLDAQGALNQSNERADICEKYYFAADRLAIFYQRRRDRIGKLIIALAGISYICLNVFSDFYESIFALLLYVALLCLAVILFGFVKRRRYHEYYVSNRAIAEGVRVQYYWFMGDVRGSHNIEAQVQDYYLRRQKGRLEWVRMAIRTINLLSIARYERCSRADTPDFVKKVADVWLGQMDRKNAKTGVWEFPISPNDGIKEISHNGQSGYFLSKSITRKSDVVLPAGSDRKTAKVSPIYVKSKLLYGLATLAMAVSIIMILALTAFLVISPNSNVLDMNVIFSVSLKNVVVFVAGMLPIVAMILREWVSFMGYDEDVDRYAWYYSIFKRTIIEIDECCRNTSGNYKDANSLRDAIKSELFEIGREALAENADWVMLNEKRAPEIPSN